MSTGENGKSNGKHTLPSGSGSAEGSGKPGEARDQESEDDLAPDELAVALPSGPEEPDTGMPPAVADLVAACVRYVATRYGVPLDFTSDTLSLVDQYVRDGRGELSARPESLDLLSGTIGAYLGEVVRREHGGFWRAEGDPSSWRVLLSRVFLAFNPIGMAREALLVGDAEGFGAHLQLDEAEREDVEARLAALPEVDEAEFYLPTTRFEVVQIAASALRAKMESSGLGNVRFEEEDY